MIDHVFPGEVIASKNATSISNAVCEFVGLVDTVYGVINKILECLVFM